MRIFIPLFLMSFIVLQACNEPKPEPGPDSQTNTTVIVEGERGRVTKLPKIDLLDAEIIYAQAQDLKYLGKREEALYKMKYLLKQEVKDKYLYLNILKDYLEWAQILQEKGKTRKISKILKEAKEIGSNAVDLYPEFLELHYQYGEILRLTRSDREMMELLEHIVSVKDSDVYANYYLGNYYYQKDKARAKFHFHKVARYANSSSMVGLNSLYSAYYYLGQMAIDEGYFIVAIRYLEKARSYYNQGFEIDQMLAQIYAYTLDFDLAGKSFKALPLAYLTTPLAEVYAGMQFIRNDPGINELILEYKNSSSLIQAMEWYYRGDYQKALKVLKKHKLKKHQSPYYVYELYYRLHKKLGNKQKSLQYRFLMSNLSRFYKKYDLAISFLKELEQEEYLKKDVYWLIAQLYNATADYDSSIKYYQSFKDLSRTDKDILAADLQIAQVYHKNKQLKKSRDYLIKLEQQYKQPSLKMEVASFSGLMRLEQQEYDQALSDFKRAYDYNNNNARVYYLLSSLYARRKSYDEAIAVLENGLHFYPEDANLKNLLAYMYAETNKKLSTAFELINQALLREPHNLAFLDTKAWVLYKLGKNKKSLKLFHTVIARLYYYEDQEGKDEIYLHLGEVYESMGQQDKALEFYETGKAFNPSNPQLLEKIKKLNEN